MSLHKNAKKQIFHVVFLVVLVAVTLVVLFTSNKELNFESIGNFLKSCDYRWMIAVAGAMILSVVFEGLSLHFILRGLGARPKLHSSLAYATADVYYSAITPSASGGQPASAYYMVKDGIGAGKASFALVFNLVAYTASIIIIGTAALILRPEYFGQINNWLANVLIILGFVLQAVLLLFFFGCMFWGKAVLKIGNWIIKLLTKIRIVKRPEKWQTKLANEVAKYKECLYALKEHPLLSVINLLFNLGQRISAICISCFVILAAVPEPSFDLFIDLFAMQALVIIGYNTIPLPGGVGAFEFLYVYVYGIGFERALILAALMVTRTFSYYLRMTLSGVYTLGYHVRQMRRKPKETITGVQKDDEKREET